GMCMISPVRTVAELADREDTHSVVLGKVVETADFCSEGRGYRLLTIAVDSSYKAGLTGEVKVVEPGTTLAPDCRPEAPGEKSVPQPGAYADFPFERHLRTETGVEVVAFLSAEKTGEKGATHSLVTGPQGLFVKRDKAFVRSIVDDEAARDEGIESRIPADGVREMLSRLTR
ncbi:MAG: hypothetical protein Q4B08_14645, partial [Propionibacteriaceae bacterium]|nr:hypothetical protein [Propionibacteriaceae bacterium]